ncbi:Uncharacterized protein Adt_31713 [Abeliophyllum distichum]|uniref:Uncharacterized protein n=1 Tax=Abeliophyllum distichum TaxID=126358 RepID=A0ABD1REW9_9LAMI
MLSKKRKPDENETVALTEECSAILLNKLPPKLKDPGSFKLPCTIGEFYNFNALCDLGASVNLMPLSVYRIEICQSYWDDLFLATSRPLIDVEKGELSLRVQDEQAVFSMYTIPEQPIDLEECFRVDEGVKLGQKNCKPATGGLVAPIKDENGRFKIWRAKEKACKASNCKQCRSSKDQFKPP